MTTMLNELNKRLEVKVLENATFSNDELTHHVQLQNEPVLLVKGLGYVMINSMQCPKAKSKGVSVPYTPKKGIEYLNEIVKNGLKSAEDITIINNEGHKHFNLPHHLRGENLKMYFELCIK